MKTQGFFLLRRPLLSKEIFFGFQNAVGNDPALFEYYLKIIYSDSLLQQALHLASPTLHQQVLRLIEGKLENGKEKLLQALFKYLIRMSTRCTPFGLFAGYSLGTVRDQTKIRFAAGDPLLLHARLDAAYLTDLARFLLQKEFFLKHAVFYPNTSLYKIRDTYRYVEPQADSSQGFILQTVKSSPYLELVLNRAKAGVKTHELTALLAENKVPKKKANEFVNSLIEKSMLISEFQMSATGEPYLSLLKTALKNMPTSGAELERVSLIGTLLKQNTDLISTYEKIRPLVSFPGFTAHSKHLLQTDLRFKTEHCQISSRFSELITHDLKALLPLFSKTVNKDLKQFARRLFQRFGRQQTSLLLALDEVAGTGFGSLNPTGASELSLLEDLDPVFETGPESQPDSSFTILCKNLLKKAEQHSLTTIELTREDIALSSESGPELLPESFSLLGTIITSSEDQLESGDFNFDLKAMAGPSSLALITRFAESNPELEAKLRQAAENEQRLHPDVIYAEICHVPGPEALNILKRPTLYAHEIPYLSASSQQQHFQIQPSELMVSSPDGVSLVLSCPRLGKQIIPRLTSAHNYSNGLPFYRFLCELAQQAGGPYLNWDWPWPLDQTFFPRVTYKHLILHKATWYLDSSIHHKLTGDTHAVLAAWNILCQKRGIPRYVQIQQGDNTLLIDGQSIFSLQLLCSYLKKNTRLVLTEYLTSEGPGFLTEASKSLDHEIIMPFLNNESSPGLSAYPAPLSPEPAFYTLGGEWLYVKIYCSSQAADVLLTQILFPFCERLVGKGTLQQWFYIRYFDPKGHLRIRMKLTGKKDLWSSVLHKLHAALKPFLDSGEIADLKTDSYQREMERYPFIPYSTLEALFSIDSLFACHGLRFLNSQMDPDLKWLLALRGCDQLLDDLGLSTHEKSQVTQDLYDQFCREFDKEFTYKVILDKKYRKFKKRIASFLNPSQGQQKDALASIPFFDARSSAIQSVIKKGDVLPRRALKELATNLVHLFLNRWLSTLQRRQEWVLYHFLKKYYNTMLNLSKSTKS